MIIKVTPTTFWLKYKKLPKCTKFCSTRKLEVAAKIIFFTFVDKKLMATFSFRLFLGPVHTMPVWLENRTTALVPS